MNGRCPVADHDNEALVLYDLIVPVEVVFADRVVDDAADNDARFLDEKRSALRCSVSVCSKFSRHLLRYGSQSKKIFPANSSCSRRIFNDFKQWCPYPSTDTLTKYYIIPMSFYDDDGK